MLKQIAASQAAKTLALCVCPVVTAGVVATKVPQVRRAVHKATAPAKPERKRAPAALTNVAIPPCTPVAPFATLPRVAAALPAAALPSSDLGLVPTSPPTGELSYPVNNPGLPFYNAPPSIGGGGGGGGVIIPPGGPGGGGGGENPPPPPPTSGVPEPETWVQVLAGFELAGGTIRYMRVRNRARIKAEVA